MTQTTIVVRLCLARMLEVVGSTKIQSSNNTLNVGPPHKLSIPLHSPTTINSQQSSQPTPSTLLLVIFNR
jgi:hypothetical protein